MRWNGHDYRRIDMQGAIALTNKKREAVEVEVRRSVLGLAGEADSGGVAVQQSLAELWTDTPRPEWWSWWNFPYWWYHWNGLARFEWKLRLEPGATVKLGATWHYYWE